MNFADIEESQLIEVAKTNANAFAELYRRYVKKIYNFFYYRTLEKVDAEDLTSHTFEKALKNLVKLKPNSNFGAWIFKIAHNLLIDYYRKKKPQISIDKVNISFTEDFISDIDKKEQWIKVLEEIISLPKVQQEVLLLKYQQGFSNKEIGNIIGKSEGAVKQLLHRGLKELRKKFLV